MSRKTYSLSYERCVRADDRYDIEKRMGEEKEKLGDYVRRIIHEKGLTYPKVRANSGNKIATSTISDIVKGKYERLSPETARALARGLMEMESEIFSRTPGLHHEVVSGYRESEFERLYIIYTRLNEKHRDKVHTLMESLEGFMLGLLQRQETKTEEQKPQNPAGSPEDTLLSTRR